MRELFIGVVLMFISLCLLLSFGKMIQEDWKRVIYSGKVVSISGQSYKCSEVPNE